MYVGKDPFKCTLLRILVSLSQRQCQNHERLHNDSRCVNHHLQCVDYDALDSCAAVMGFASGMQADAVADACSACDSSCKQDADKTVGEPLSIQNVRIMTSQNNAEAPPVCKSMVSVGHHMAISPLAGGQGTNERLRHHHASSQICPSSYSTIRCHAD